MLAVELAQAKADVQGIEAQGLSCRIEGSSLVRSTAARSRRGSPSPEPEIASQINRARAQARRRVEGAAHSSSVLDLPSASFVACSFPARWPRGSTLGRTMELCFRKEQSREQAALASLEVPPRGVQHFGCKVWHSHRSCFRTDVNRMIQRPRAGPLGYTVRSTRGAVNTSLIFSRPVLDATHTLLRTPESAHMTATKKYNLHTDRSSGQPKRYTL